MEDSEIKSMIQKHEGYRDRVYLDSLGVPTVGYGHALHVGSRIPFKVAALLFEQDYKGALSDYEILIKNYNLKLNPVRRAVLIDMLFNMGLLKVYGFKKFLAALEAQVYSKAAEEMLDSLWAQQVGKRAIKLSKMMEAGHV